MKTFTIILFVLTISFKTIFPQGYDESLGWKSVELFFVTKGLPQNTSIRYSIEATSTVWDWRNYGNGIKTWILVDSLKTADHPILFLPEADNSDPSDYTSWDGLNSSEEIHSILEHYDNFGAGLYKIKNNYSNSYFYLDIRDPRYPSNAYYDNYYTQKPGGNDFLILFDAAVNKYYLNPNMNIVDVNDEEWLNYEVQNSEYISIWELKGLDTPSTQRFPEFWGNCLNLIDDGNNHPKLVWGKYPDENHSINGYNIYRKIGSSQYAWIAYTTALHFVDLDTHLTPIGGHFGVVVSYKISAIETPNFESGFSNIVSCNIQGAEIEKKKYSIGNSNIKYELYQNYPNPFNPNTSICFQLSKPGFVSIKVFDFLGNEVAILVNSELSEGFHQINFSANVLSAGIYYYSLFTTDFVETKSMILVK